MLNINLDTQKNECLVPVVGYLSVVQYYFPFPFWISYNFQLTLAVGSFRWFRIRCQ